MREFLLLLFTMKFLRIFFPNELIVDFQQGTIEL